jgi:hypothetical protein
MGYFYKAVRTKNERKERNDIIMKKIMAALLIVVLLAASTVPAYAYTSCYPTSTSPWAG